MEGIKRPWNVHFIGLLFYCAIISARGNPIYATKGITLDHAINSRDHGSSRNSSGTADCKPEEYAVTNAVFLKNDDIFLRPKNITIHSTEYRREGEKIIICLRFLNASSEEITLNCKYKIGYGSNEFRILANGSALVHAVVIPREEYMLRGKQLLTCVPDDYSDIDDDGITLSQISVYIGQVGSLISVIALSAHLVTFCFLPTLRNLPGYNLASLSVAFLLGYSFILIGQIPDVRGRYCIASAVLQQNFFLAAFFCMNVLAFDVWRTLKLATEKLVVGSQGVRKKRFLWYSLYAWGCPLLISLISVIVDNTDGVPDSIKPYYGKDDTCWLTNNEASTIFFAAPAFTLFVINGVFFISSAWIIYSNKMKHTSDMNNQTVKLNYVLYLRLGIMMGLTWLIGVIALLSRIEIIWFIFDLLNSLQGLFLFLLFTCTKKVIKQLRNRKRSSKSVSEKQHTLSTSSNNFNSRGA